MKLIMNGTLYDDKEAVISVYDHGFLYGMGMFETFRTYGGVPFLLSEHLERLKNGCLELGIRVEINVMEIQEQVETLLRANGLEDGYVRLSVSAGDAPLGLPAGDYEEPKTILYTKPLPERDPLTYEQGKSLQKLVLRRNSPEGSIRLKSFHYMNNILAKREMARYPWSTGAEGLFLTVEGHLAEGIVSNLFCVRGGICRTPSLDTGILPGITRAYVLQMARELGIPTEEGRWPWTELVRADEVFVTNSIQEIVPICLLYDEQGNAASVGNGTVGPITKRLMSSYGTAAHLRKTPI